MSERDSQAAAAVDPAAWVEAHGDALFAYARRRVRHDEAAEDLVQETLLAAVRSAHGFEGRSSVRTWLIGILKNKIIDYLRRAARESDRQAEEDLERRTDGVYTRSGHWREGIDEWTADPHQVMQRKQFYEALGRCMTKLPERHRLILTLSVVDQTPSEDICKTLAITASNLWVMLHRARVALRECMERHWIKKT